MKKGIIVSIVVVVVLAIWLGINNNNNNNKEELTLEEGLVLTDLSVEIDNQQAGADKMVINRAFLLQKGYIIIHEEKNEGPGPILGSSSIIPAGEITNIDISISRPGKVGENMYAMVHSDNGDDKFDPTDDKPAFSEDGNIVMMRFTFE